MKLVEVTTAFKAMANMLPAGVDIPQFLFREGHVMPVSDKTAKWLVEQKLAKVRCEAASPPNVTERPATKKAVAKTRASD